jgi:hypothetical protein
MAAFLISLTEPRDSRDTTSWEYTKETMSLEESWESCGSVIHGGAKQYTDTRLPIGSPLDRTVLHVFGSAHIYADH